MARVSKSIKNVTESMGGYILKLLVQFIGRSIFIQILGREYLGLSGLFSNILSVLALVELGFGGAISFSLYIPLAVGDQKTVKALMRMFHRVYLLVFWVVLIGGLAVTPYLHVFVKQLPDIPGLQWIYMLYVINTAASYLCVYKQTLIIADQRQYIVSRYVYGCAVAMTVLQTVLLVLTKDYFLYLYVMLAFTLLQNLLISRKADQMYPFLKERAQYDVPRGAYDTIFRNIRAMLYQKVGHVMVTSTDNILMAKFVDLGTVGLYSNYLMITSALTTAMSLIYNGIMASIGNVGATENDEVKEQIFNRIDFFTQWLLGFCTVCLFCLLSPFISLWLGEAYRFPMRIELLICLNFMVQGFRQSVITTKNAMGLYWVDRHKALITAFLNLGISIVLGKRIGVAGILLGTLISSLLTDFWVEPLVVFRVGFHAGASGYFRRYLISAVTTGINLWGMYVLCQRLPDGIGGFLLKMGVCIVVPNLLYLAVYGRRPEFRYFVELGKTLLWKKRRTA